MSDPAANNEMAAALLAAFDQLIEKVKARRPIGTDKKPTDLGFVYSQLVQGMLVDPDDYLGPWSPAGGSSIQDAIEKGKAPAKAAQSAAPAAPAVDAAPPTPTALSSSASMASRAPASPPSSAPSASLSRPRASRR